MARISLFQSAALAVLAAFGTTAIPANAQDQEPDRQEAREALQQARQDMRAERQAAQQQQQAQQPERQAAQAAAPQQQAEVQVAQPRQDWTRGDGDRGGRQDRSDARQQQNTPQPQAQAQGGGGEWHRGGGGERNGWQGRGEARDQQAAPQQPVVVDNGWRSQRASDGQRQGRSWDNNGAVSQAPGWRGGEDHARQDGTQWHHRDETRGGGDWSGQRNRTYSDPNRRGAYGGDRDHDHTGGSWSGRQDNRNGSYGYGNTYGSYGYGNTYGSYGNSNQNYGYQNGYNSGSRDHQRWDHNDWRRDTRYNWSGYRNQHRDLYRAGQYYSPYSNYGYSRLSIGFFLNSGFFGQNYWINDPWQYRLPSVYGPYRWVRYYDDVLLVDIYSGEVVDVIHDFFW